MKKTIKVINAATQLLIYVFIISLLLFISEELEIVIPTWISIIMGVVTAWWFVSRILDID